MSDEKQHISTLIGGQSDLTKTPEAKARVNLYPPAHHAGWDDDMWTEKHDCVLVLSLTMVVSYVLTIHVYLSTYLVVTIWLTYLPTYVVTMVVKRQE